MILNAQIINEFFTVGSTNKVISIKQPHMSLNFNNMKKNLQQTYT